ncbi:MAG: peptidoglycan D,D-transpeptidase FtsI family protein [Anaerolineae bacterium]
MGDEFDRRARYKLGYVNVGISLLAVLLCLVLGFQSLRVVFAGGEDARRWKPEAVAQGPAVAVRGNILDRDGALLAGVEYRWRVGVSPSAVRENEVDALAEIISPYFPEWGSDKLKNLLRGDREYVYLGNLGYPAGVELYQKLKEKNLHHNRVTLNPMPSRVYPEGSLAGHLLGFVNAEGKAYYGVEKAYERYLRGEDIPKLEPTDKHLADLGWRFVQNASPEPVCDIILTIDRAAQYVAEQELRSAVLNAGAVGGTILVMDPRTGEILASASYPAYSPAQYTEVPPEVWSDPVVSRQYEPGSVFKVVTLAAGLNAGVITPQSTYVDTGCIELGGKPICNMDKIPRGLVDMQTVLVYSLNLGSTYVSTRLGPKDFYEYVRLFGFGERTDVDLAQEIAGDVHWYGTSKFHGSDLGTNSFGQGIAVTPLQMLTAVSAVANDGLLMHPHVAKGIIYQGRVVEIRPYAVRQVIQPAIAHQLTEMLVEAVEQGAPQAVVPGYRVAGKSGTAEVPGKGGYEEGRYIASFVGYLPADNPRLAILVKIDEPRGETLGARVAGPVFSRVAAQLAQMFGIPSGDGAP